MQHPSRSPRTNVRLSPSLHKNLNAYALGASAAGVAILSITPADAEVVFTQANGHIAKNQVLSLDLNHDGIPDFALINAPHFGPNSHSYGESFSVRPAPGNEIWAANNVSYFAAALPAGVSIGSKAPFHSSQLLMAFAERTDIAYFSGGDWKSATNRFLGLKFFINGEVHFGWARLTVTANEHQEKVTATLTGYAYETAPNTPLTTGQIMTSHIKAGQTRGNARHPTLASLASAPENPMLGMLALGAPALSAWRREESSEDARSLG
jgi:hypothetical protein